MRRTWLDLAKEAGAGNDEVADYLLWSGSAFPFASVRTVWYQLRHSLRHKVCIDDPDAMCWGKRCRRRAVSTGAGDE